MSVLCWLVLAFGVAVVCVAVALVVRRVIERWRR